MSQKVVGHSGALAEAMPPMGFIAFTIKPKCNKLYAKLTPLEQSRLLLNRLKGQIDRMKKCKLTPVVGYEIHYEMFQNGNIHAHGMVHIISSVKLSETVWPMQMQKEFIRNAGIGEHSMLCKGNFGDEELWFEYVKKDEVLPAKYIITPYGASLNIGYCDNRLAICKGET